ncbi:MAG: isoprenoid biosynthesis glyoxalase ElbB [Candidatus Brocadiae bacterium]|nr:isoprenoid biosynthesis glyoxalase ElbB [Candidatus Brocadiia bacterium]
MPKVGICLAGCGVKDGSEIHESVITILALDRANAEIVFFAPEGNQHHVVNHVSLEAQNEKRDMLLESARIARGNIKNIKNIKASDLDAVIFPGGFGAALNLCNFGLVGEKCKVHPEVERLILEMHKAKKPIGAICIAPSLVAKVLGSQKVQVTIGTDPGTASKLEAMGAVHVACNVDDIVVDTKNKVVTTPAYMLAKSIKESASGIEKLVKKIVEMIA